MNAQRRFWGAVAVTAALLTAPGMATATGLAYRDVTTGRWKGIAKDGDVRAAGAFATRTFTGFSGTLKAAIDAIPAGPCGGAAVVAAFSGRVTGGSPNNGLFLYDATTDTIIDAVIQGAATPIGGTWQSFSNINPAVAIDASTCLVHVYFPGQAVGVAPNDTGIFDASFGPLPGFAPGPVTVVAQEGVTLAPAPFPGGSVFASFVPSVRVAGASDLVAGGDVHVAFRGQVTGGGVTGADNTGVFLATTFSPGLTTGAREGDLACPPVWSGTTFAEFPTTLDVGIGDAAGPFGPQVVFRAKSVGGPPTSDTAIIDTAPAVLPCGASLFTPAIEGAATPLGGTYAELSSSTPVAAAGGLGPFLTNVVFLANVSGGTAPRGLFYAGSPTYIAVTVAAQGVSLTGTALGAGNVSLGAPVVGPSVNALNSVAFRAGVSGAGQGLFFFNPGGPTVPESIAGGYRNVRLDRLGNMTAHFP